METIVASCISAGAAILVCMINNHTQQKKAKEENSKTVALIDYRLDELTKHVEKHNQVIERTYKLEEALRVDEEKIKVVNHRINDLERKVE